MGGESGSDSGTEIRTLPTGQVRRQLAQDMVKILAAPPNNLTERARRQLGATIQ